MVFLFWCCVCSFVSVAVLLFPFVPPVRGECFNRCGFSHLLLVGLVFPFVLLLSFLVCVGAFCFGFLSFLGPVFFSVSSFFLPCCVFLLCFALCALCCFVLLCGVCFCFCPGCDSLSS